MRFHLIPRDERFVQMLTKSAENVQVGADALLALIDDYTDVEAQVRRLRDIEHAGDEITHAIFDALNRTFVTPFDRDDIGRLASTLDDVIDWIEEAAKRFHVYKLDRPTELTRQFAVVLVEQARAIAAAVPLLETLGKAGEELRTHVVELHRLENVGDELMITALSTLYDDAKDIPSLVRAIQLGDIYDVLEQATDRAEHVGIALESIAVKSG